MLLRWWPYLGATLLLTLLTCAVEASEKVGTKVVELKDLQISIPAEWEVLKGTNTLLTARAPAEGPLDAFGENVQLVTQNLPRPATAEQVLASQIRNVQREYGVVSQGKVERAPQTTLWYAMVSRKPTRPKEQLTTATYFLVRNNRLYALICTAETVKFSKVNRLFSQIARSIVFPEPADTVRAAEASTLSGIGTEQGATGEEKVSEVAPPMTEEEKKHKEAFEQGRGVGRVVFQVMLLTIVLWGAVRFVRWLFTRA